jgi:hypothetical protein
MASALFHSPSTVALSASKSCVAIPGSILMHYPPTPPSFLPLPRCITWPSAAAAYGHDIMVECNCSSQPLSPPVCVLSDSTVPSVPLPLFTTFTVQSRAHIWQPSAVGGGVSLQMLSCATQINTYRRMQLLRALCPLPPRTRFLSPGGSLAALAKGKSELPCFVTVTTHPPSPHSSSSPLNFASLSASGRALTSLPNTCTLLP